MRLRALPLTLRDAWSRTVQYALFTVCFVYLWGRKTINNVIAKEFYWIIERYEICEPTLLTLEDPECSSQHFSQVNIYEPLFCNISNLISWFNWFPFSRSCSWLLQIFGHYFFSTVQVLCIHGWRLHCTSTPKTTHCDSRTVVQILCNNHEYNDRVAYNSSKLLFYRKNSCFNCIYDHLI